MAKGRGRPKGSRNRGFFFRAGRGWHAKVDGQFVPLHHPSGERMRERSTPVADVRRAYLQTLNGVARQTDSTATIFEVCTAYLSKAETDSSKSTYDARAGTLFDFCYGFPPKYRKGDKKPTEKVRIHPGYGSLIAQNLRPIDVDRWLQAHPNWKGGRRSYIQAVLRAMNYGVEAGLLDFNPVKGYKVPRQNARVTYITPEQEAAMLKVASPAFQIALKVCIRTGMRPGCEFAKLTAKHVVDHGSRMELVFQPAESKTKRLRVIRVTDTEIISVLRKQIEKHPAGPLFRNTQNAPWTRPNLSLAFRRARRRAGVEFDKDCCIYSTRHTYAKRILMGFWTGKQTNIETLARLMGNSPQVCRDHYLQWTESYNEPLWESA